MSDGIVELRGRGKGRRMDIPAGEAPVLRLAPGSKVMVDDVELVFHEPGPFIVVTLDRWQRTVHKAIANAQAEVEAAETVRKTRQARRRDARN